MSTHLNPILVPPTLGARYLKITSESMVPTLRIGETIVAYLNWYPTYQPMREEVVVYQLPTYEEGEVIYCHRIAALPGERILVKQGRAYINGEPAIEPYADLSNPEAELNYT